MCRACSEWECVCKCRNMDFLARYICVCCLIVSGMASSKMTEFFPDIKGNLSLVTWAHAVNNKSLLEDTLHNNKTMMIEADVSIGDTKKEKNTTIMAHPPNNSSDLSLSDFLDTVSTFNKEVQNNVTKKGIKLDFKSTSSLERGVEKIKKYADEGAFPIWINADIFPGPINSTVTPVNDTKFFELTKNLNNIVLSVGWTTNYGPNMTGKYEETQINLMIKKIEKENLTKEITFPVRAGLAAESANELELLLKKVNTSTVTLWSSEKDPVEVQHLNKLLSTIGSTKVYIDVPESLHKQLDFRNSSDDSENTTTTTQSTSTSTITTTTNSTTTSTNTTIITTTHSTANPPNITTTTTTQSSPTPTNTSTITTTQSSATIPHHNNSSTTKAPNSGSENILKLSIMTLLFCVLICLL